MLEKLSLSKGEIPEMGGPTQGTAAQGAHWSQEGLNWVSVSKMLNEIGGRIVKIGNDLFNYMHVPMVGIINTSNFLIFSASFMVHFDAESFQQCVSKKKRICVIGL